MGRVGRTGESGAEIGSVLADHLGPLADRQAGATDYLEKGKFDAVLLERIARYAIEGKGTERTLELPAAVLRNIGEGICLIRIQDGMIVYSNPAFEKMFGRRHETMVGRHCRQLGYWRTGLGEEINNETLASRMDGSQFWCRVSLSRFDHPKHGPVLVGMHQDITEGKLSEAAMFLGADDFIVKPMDRHVLASKLSRYVGTERLVSEQLALLPVPEGGAPASVFVDLEVCKLDESGLTLVSSHLISKGVSIHLDGGLIRDISGSERPLLVSIVETWTESEGSYGALAKFDPTDQETLSNLRKWLQKA